MNSQHSAHVALRFQAQEAVYSETRMTLMGGGVVIHRYLMRTLNRSVQPWPVHSMSLWGVIVLRNACS